MANIKFNFKGEDYIISDFKKILITNKYLSWLNSKKTMQFSRHKFKKYNKKNCIKFFEGIKRSKNLFFSIHHISKSEKIHIGNSIVLIDKNNRSGELSILIGDKNYINIGLSSYVWGLIIRYLFKTHKLRIILSGTMAINKAMIKVFLKNKMKISITPKRFLNKNQDIDGIYAYIKNKNYGK